MNPSDHTPLLVMTTLPDAETAGRIARTLVEERLAACCNVLPGIQSTYRWDGKVTAATEVMMYVKTVGSRVEQLIARLRELHPYQVPEVIATPITRGNADYLAWLSASATDLPVTSGRRARKA